MPGVVYIDTQDSVTTQQVIPDQADHHTIMDDDFPLAAHAIYLDLLDSLEGTYDLSYDIDTRKSEDNLPFGWNSHRCELWDIDL